MNNNKRRNPFPGGQGGRQAPYGPPQPQQAPPPQPAAPPGAQLPQQQYDWSAYYPQVAVAGYPQQQQPGGHPQWAPMPGQPGVHSAPPQPPAAPAPPVPIPVPPPADPRFANYGYGNINYSWSHHSNPPVVPQFQPVYPPTPVSAPQLPPPQAIAHPAYGASRNFAAHSMAGPQQQPYFNQPYQPYQPRPNHLPQPPPIHMTLSHAPPQQLPPAKRPRFEPPTQPNFSGPGRGPRPPIPPRNANGTGMPQQAPNFIPQSPGMGRGSSLPSPAAPVALGPNIPSGGLGRGAMQNTATPMAPNSGGPGRGRGGMNLQSGSRGNSGGGMRGRGSNGPGGGGRGYMNGTRSAPRGPSHRHQNVTQRFHHGSMGSGPSSGFSRPPSGPSASSRGRAVHRDATPRRDDHIAAKRTLTDFRIVGVECTELAWSWGKLGLAGVHDVVHDLPTKESSKTPQAENGVEATSGESTAVKQEAVSPPKATPVALPSIPKSLLAAHQSETSRIRFYFQSPIELEDVRPGRVWGGGGVGGKRKKEYEEGEGDGQENGKRIKEYDENEGSVVSLTESMLDPSAPMSAPPNDKVDIPASSDEPLAVIKAEGASAGDVRSPREEFDGPDDEVDPASLQRPHSAPETLLPGRFAHSSTDPSYSYDTEDEESGAFSAPNASQSDLEVVLAEVDGDVADRPASESRIPTTPPSDRLVSIALAEDPDVSDACPSRDEEVAVFPPAHSLKSESDTQAAIETTQADAERPAPDDTTSEAPAPVPEAHGEAAVPKPDLAEPDRAPAPAQEPTVPLTSASPDQPSSLAIFPSTLPLVPNTTVLAEDDQDRPSARSPDRISISYAGSSRRLVLDADIVEKVKIWRGNGRIELTVMVQNETYELEARDVLVDGGDDGKSDAVGGDETGKDVPGVAESLPVMDRTEDETKPVNGENGLTGDSGAVDEKPKLSEGNAEAAVEETVKEHITPGLLASRCRGILIEAFSEATQSYVHHSEAPPTEPLDATLPPFSSALRATPTPITFIVHLDRDKPLSEPKWVRTGDIDEWLRGIYGHLDAHGDDGHVLWTGKIEVVDPDPPPTIHTVLESWSANSPVGLAKDRRRFLKEHMSSSIDNILEILLRLVRGERASHHPNQYAHTSHSPLHSALGSAVSSPNAPHAAQQTHVSLAVLAIFRMSAEYAEKAGEETGKVEERVGELVRALPQHLIYKSLDGIFREWSGSGGFSNTSSHAGRKSSLR